MCHHRGDRIRASSRTSESEDETDERDAWWSADRLREVVAARDGDGAGRETPEYPAVELATRDRDASDEEREEEPVPAHD